jgi:hypothetical protein
MTISAELKRIYAPRRKKGRIRCGPLAGKTPREADEAIVKHNFENAWREVMALYRDPDLTPQQRERVLTIHVSMCWIDTFLRQHGTSKLTGNRNRATKVNVIEVAALRFARDLKAPSQRALAEKVRRRLDEVFKRDPVYKRKKTSTDAVRAWLRKSPAKEL